MSSILRSTLPEPKLLDFSSSKFDKYTHYLFRFPAKFHPPVAKWLVQQFTDRGSTILDPFCGSGTLMVEGTVLGRHSVAVDVDPVAAFVTRAKTNNYEVGNLKREVRRFMEFLASPREGNDRTESIPPIPNIDHWFQRDVIEQLAHIRHKITRFETDDQTADFLLIAFLRIIRRVSNADPIPTSGLEVTKRMREINQGRQFDVEVEYQKAISFALAAVAGYLTVRDSATQVTAIHGSSTEINLSDQIIDAIISSPPYLGAVDYYRRHTLEQYWGSFVDSQKERLSSKHKYIGRPDIRVSDAHKGRFELRRQSSVFDYWVTEFAREAPNLVKSLTDYSRNMIGLFSHLSDSVKSRTPMVLVVGDKSWAGGQFPTSELLADLAASWFEMREHYWYPIRNRYMSYQRRNGANIRREHVLVMSKL